MAAARLTIRLDTKLKKRIVRLAKQKAKRPSQLVRDAIQFYCENADKPISCLDIAREFGLVGAIKDGPRDLSTNPKHMEGFGKS